MLQRATITSAAAQVALVDPLDDDFSRTAAHTGSLSFDTGNPALFGGDASRVKRDSADPASLEYAFDDISGADITAWYWPDQPVVPLTVEGSADGTTWTPLQILNGFGELEPPSLIAGVPGERLAEARASAETPPGVYASGERRVALNVMRADDRLAPLAPLPEGVVVETLERPEEIRLGPWLIALALVLLALDVLARVSLESVRLGGRAAELPPEDVAELPDLGGSFNDVMLFRHHLARLRHEGLLLQ